MMNPNSKTLVYEKIIGWVIVALLLLLPIIFVPTSGISLYAVKISLMAGLTGVLLIISLALILTRGSLTIPKEKMFLPLVLLPIIAILSSLVSGSFVKSFVGSVFEINTAAFLLLGVILTLLISVSQIDLITLRKAIFAFVLSTLILLLSVILKVAALHGFFPQFITSLTAKFPDYLALGGVETAIVLGAGAIIALNAFVFGYITLRWQKVLAITLIAGSLLFAGVIGFKSLIILAALFSLAHFVYTLSISKTSISPASLFVLVLSLVLLLGGASLSNLLSGIFKISDIDVRPNVEATTMLIKESWSVNPILGVGPNKFTNLWNLKKPDGVNLTNFWNTDFVNGFGYLPTAITELGLLGALAIISFLVLFIYTGYKAIFREVDDWQKRFVITSSFFAGLYFWIVSFIYTTSIVVLGLAFIMTGLFAASIFAWGIGNKKELNLFENPKTNFVSTFLVVALLLFSIASIYFMGERVVASSIFAQGQNALQSGDLNKAGELFVKSAQLSPSESSWREGALTFLAILQNKLSQIDRNKPLDESVRAELQIYIGNSILAANNAIKIDNKNYANYFILGNIYETLARSGVGDAMKEAKNNYEEARKRSPKNPLIPLVLARLSAMEGDADSAFSSIDESLTLKPNFTDAYFLKAQIEASMNNASAAIKSVEDATLVDPLNAGIYFQLGLLKYNVRDWNGAARALERASSLVSNYANAQYFLGLSYYNLNKRDEALRQFEEIQKTNPDNQEVQLILSNLKANRSPFQNAKAPIDDKPEKRNEPPIEEN